MPTASTHQPLSNTKKGRLFEHAAVNYLTDHAKLQRPDQAKKLSPWTVTVSDVIHPTGGLSVFEVSTLAEGLWVNSKGDPVWVECSGVWDGGSSRPGFRRSDTTRKIAGTIGCLATVCRINGVQPPAVHLVTSHLPRVSTTASLYLTWGVILLIGPKRCTITVLDDTGKARNVSARVLCQPSP